jgi:hypothetical protein
MFVERSTHSHENILLFFSHNHMMSNQREPNSSPYTSAGQEHLLSLQHMNSLNENSQRGTTNSQNTKFNHPSLLDKSHSVPVSFAQDPINDVTVSKSEDLNILLASQRLYEEIKKLEIVLMQRKKSLMLLQQKLLMSQGNIELRNVYQGQNRHEFTSMIPDYTTAFIPLPLEQPNFKFGIHENLGSSLEAYKTLTNHVPQFEQSEFIQGPHSSFKSAVENESFPIRLHRLLVDLETHEDYYKIAEFLPDGQSFVIKDPKLFEQTIIPLYFPRIKSFATFQKQLTLYGFQLLANNGLMNGIYCHPHFQRHQLNMVCKIRKFKKEK